jgi:hypothetical protein
MSDRETTPPTTAPEAPDGAAPALPGEALDIASGYAFTGPALDLGALEWDGRCRADAQIRVPLSTLNRHGLVAGATGTGKTKTLQLVAEQLSAQGVPVFLADIKGDLSGVCEPGSPDPGSRGAPARSTSGGRRPGSRPSSTPWAVRGTASPYGPRSPASARCCCPRCWSSTGPRSSPSG